MLAAQPRRNALTDPVCLGQDHSSPAPRPRLPGPPTCPPAAIAPPTTTSTTTNTTHTHTHTRALQYQDKSGQLMMLNTDMWLLWDK